MKQREQEEYNQLIEQQNRQRLQDQQKVIDSLENNNQPLLLRKSLLEQQMEASNIRSIQRDDREENVIDVREKMQGNDRKGQIEKNKALQEFINREEQLLLLLKDLTGIMVECDEENRIYTLRSKKDDSIYMTYQAEVGFKHILCIFMKQHKQYLIQPDREYHVHLFNNLSNKILINLMNQNNRFCTQEGHQWFEVYQICTYRQCIKSRWCCSLCLSEGIHDHDQYPKNNHIINQAQLPDRVKEHIENIKNYYLNSVEVIKIQNLLSSMVKETKELEQNIVQFRLNLERYLNNPISDDDNFKLQSLLDLVEGQYYLQLNDDDLNQLIDINVKLQNNSQFQLQDKLDKIHQQLSMLSQKLKGQQQIINIKNYEIQKIEQIKKERKIYPSMINKKEQYLVYSVASRLNIYDIKMKNIAKVIKQKRELTILQFTPDSKYLFAGDNSGFVNGYFVLNGFKRFYKQQIHHTYISQIIIQKQYLITASGDKTIIKTDFIKKQQIFKLIGHSGSISSIDYDIQKDVIISTSSDKFIKVWDCANQRILIDISDNTQYNHIQFMNNKQDIMCKFDKSLLKFTIDYQNKKLIKYHFYINEQVIIGFQFVNNDQILIICGQYCKILDNQGVSISVIHHNLGLDYNPYCSCNSEQLDNPNYFILQDCKLLYYKQDKKISLLRVTNWN